MTGSAEVPVKRDKRTAILELYKVNPYHGYALSGQNPPLPPQIEIKKSHVPSVFKYVLPLGLLLYWLWLLSHRSVFTTIVAGIFFLILGTISWAIGKNQQGLEPVAAPIPPPFKIEVLQYESIHPILDGDLVLTLSYEFPVEFTRDVFQNVLRTKYSRSVGEFIDSKFAAYRELCSRIKVQPTSNGFLDTIDTDEIEASLVPSFGRIIYEAQVKVFRFDVRKKFLVTAPPVPSSRHRGFVGISR